MVAKIRLMAGILLALLATQAVSQSTTVTMTEGMGEVLRLPRPATNVFVGDPAVAAVQAVSGDSLVISGVGPGVTNVFALDDTDDLIASYEVVVSPATDRADGLLGGSGAAAQARGSTAAVVGTARDIDEARAVLSARRGLAREGVPTLDRSALGLPGQVSLRVRFVEASRSDFRRLGFDVSAIDAGTFSLVTGARLAREGGLRTSAGGSIDDLDVDVALRALEERGVVEILSEPTLTTVSGRRATFQAGGEFAFPVPRGEEGVGIEFRSFGVSIDFLPTILSEGRIAVEVAPEVSFLDDSSGVTLGDVEVPGLSVRRAETTVEVSSGQTFAIAGLYEQQRSDTGRGVPGFRRAPILGALFDTRENSSSARELVIFITPYLAQASDARRPAPTRPRVADTVGFILE